jgi:transposase
MDKQKNSIRDLKQRGICVRVGMEAAGYSRWFERLLAKLRFEVWMGDPAEIKAKRVKKQKFDREDARLLIVGHEQEPSGQVFKNIQVDFLKKVPPRDCL